MSDIKRNERRRKHYKMLREAGYDRESATRLKDFDLDSVKEMCDIKKEAMNDVTQIDHKVNKQLEIILKRKKR